MVADAPVGTCDDLDTFAQCTLIQSLRLVLLPLVAMASAGLLLAMAAGQGELVGRLRERVPLLDRAIPVTNRPGRSEPAGDAH